MMCRPAVDVDYRRKPSLHSSIEGAFRSEMRRLEHWLPTTASTIRADLQMVCTEAKRLDMRAELLVIAMKKVWQEIPETRSFSRPTQMDSLLNDAVRMMLDEYYGPSSRPQERDD